VSSLLGMVMPDVVCEVVPLAEVNISCVYFSCSKTQRVRTCAFCVVICALNDFTYALSECVLFE